MLLDILECDRDGFFLVYYSIEKKKNEYVEVLRGSTKGFRVGNFLLFYS